MIRNVILFSQGRFLTYKTVARLLVGQVSVKIGGKTTYFHVMTLKFRILTQLRIRMGLETVTKHNLRIIILKMAIIR